jgi:hypothetical protein
MLTQTEIMVRPLTPFLGAEIAGVDASRAISTGVLTQLNDALIKSQLLILRNQTLTVEQQIAFSANFGELEQFSPHPHYTQHREIFPVSNREEDGYLNVGHYWHHDGSFLETPLVLTDFVFCKLWYEAVPNIYKIEEGFGTRRKRSDEPTKRTHKCRRQNDLSADWGRPKLRHPSQ